MCSQMIPYGRISPVRLQDTSSLQQCYSMIATTAAEIGGAYEAVEPLSGSYSALLAQSGSQMAAAHFQSLDMSYGYLAYIALCD